MAMKEGSPAEEAMDKKQGVKGAKLPFGGKRAAPFGAKKPYGKK